MAGCPQVLHIQADLQSNVRPGPTAKALQEGQQHMALERADQVGFLQMGLFTTCLGPP